MDWWNEAIDLLRVAMFTYAQATGGSLGSGIVVVTLTLRMAMLPLTLWVARVSAAHQEARRTLKPKLDRVREQYKGDPARVAAETRRIFTDERVSPLPLNSCLGTLLQVPVLLAIFSAVRRVAEAGGRFLWIRDIARPDIALTVIVTALTGATVAMAPNSTEQGRAVLVALPVIVTVIALSQMAAGVGLYWGASSAVSVLQAVLVRRTR